MKQFYENHKVGIYMVGVLIVMALIATVILNGDTSAIDVNP